MGKVLSWAVTLVIQLAALGGAHLYYTGHPRPVLIVVDSSYGLSSHQARILQWIEDYQDQHRYRTVHYATDKTYLGTGVANRDKLFRVSFGQLDVGRLDQQYPDRQYPDRILLTFSGQSVDGWRVVDVGR